MDIRVQWQLLSNFKWIHRVVTFPKSKPGNIKLKYKTNLTFGTTSSLHHNNKSAAGVQIDLRQQCLPTTLSTAHVFTVKPVHCCDKTRLYVCHTARTLGVKSGVVLTQDLYRKHQLTPSHICRNLMNCGGYLHLQLDFSCNRLRKFRLFRFHKQRVYVFLY